MASDAISAPLLEWYDRNARILPWRVPPGATERADPYRVWLSEVMLQQTTVKAVIPFFERFTARWPSVAELAAAGQSEVMAEWAGLGYYSRARNLHACARAIVDRHGSAFPRTAAELRALPGIGDYTSASIAAIAFGEAVPVVDGNVERVVARQIALDVPPARAKARVRETVSEWLDPKRPGDFAQATMDLGATICTPRNPVCALCPISAACVARRAGDPLDYPVKAPKKVRPVRRGTAFVARRPDGAVLLTRRAETGLLGGTVCPPTSGWSSREDGPLGLDGAPLVAEWALAGRAEHGFTHFEIVLDVYRAETDAEAPAGHWWSTDPDAEGLTTLARRILEAAG